MPSPLIFAGVKNIFLKISVFILFAAVLVETTSSLWIKAESAIVLQESEDNGETKKAETEKEDVKDKLFQETANLQGTFDHQQIFVLEHIYFKYSAYLSLPEIPPELS
jgi:hypothetical protein